MVHAYSSPVAQHILLVAQPILCNMRLMLNSAHLVKLGLGWASQYITYFWETREPRTPRTYRFGLHSFSENITFKLSRIYMKIEMIKTNLWQKCFCRWSPVCQRVQSTWWRLEEDPLWCQAQRTKQRWLQSEPWLVPVQVCWQAICQDTHHSA